MREKHLLAENFLDVGEVFACGKLQSRRKTLLMIKEKDFLKKICLRKNNRPKYTIVFILVEIIVS